jgi:hypothetical protein
MAVNTWRVVWFDNKTEPHQEFVTGSKANAERYGRTVAKQQGWRYMPGLLCTKEEAEAGSYS